MLMSTVAHIRKRGSMDIHPGDIWVWTGMHKAPHQTMCQICGSGFFQIHWGRESCDVCPENHYCPVSTGPSARYVTWDCENEPLRVGKIYHKFSERVYSVFRVQMWTPFSVPAMLSVQRAAWLQATAWRLSSAKQGTLVNWLLSLLLC